MIKEYVAQWDANKHQLQAYFELTQMKEYSTYLDVLKALLKYVLTDFPQQVDVVELKEGACEGDALFIVRKARKSLPTDWVSTHVSYGSCSCCDTLQQVTMNQKGIPTSFQVKGFMTIALHLMQRMRPLRGSIKESSYAEKLYLFNRLLQVRDYYRKGWVPDYENEDPKYTVETRVLEIVQSTTISSHAVFSFQTEEIAQSFLYSFRDSLTEIFDIL